MAKINLYQQLADDLRDQIKAGTYLLNQKLPSIRQLAKQRQLSVATVQRALEELEIRGLIQARAKSGFYVLDVADIHKTDDLMAITSFANLLPKSVKVHELASNIFHQCEKKDVINLGTSYPSAYYYPTKGIQSIASKIIKQNINPVVEVHFSAGYRPLREVLAARLNQQGCFLKAKDLIITNGCLEALSLCLRAVANPGDTIAVESPGFVGLFQIIESLGLKAIEIPCHPQEGLSIEALQLAMEQWDIKAVAIVASFSNPLGTNMPEANRKRLVEMLADASIPLIEDDLLADLSFDGSRTKPCKAFDKKGLVLHCSSVSKTLGSGLRVGWIAAGAYYKEVSYFKTFTNISASNLSQMIVAEFLQSQRFERHIRQLTQQLAQRMSLFQRLIEQNFPKGTRLSRPKGGCVLWLMLPEQLNGYEFFKRALELNIAIIPGQLSSATAKFDQCIRINCASDPEIDIEASIKTLASIARQMLVQNNPLSLIC